MLQNIKFQLLNNKFSLKIVIIFQLNDLIELYLPRRKEPDFLSLTGQERESGSHGEGKGIF